MSGEDDADPVGPRYIVDPHTLDMLVCPLTKTRLTLNRATNELISRAARVAYPIRKGVPLLSIDEARPISEEEYAGLRD